MKRKNLLIALSLLLSLGVAKATLTNFVWSSNTVSNHVRTNLLSLSNNFSAVSVENLSNINYSASNNFVAASNYFLVASNMVWGITNAKATTNFAVITPGTTTNWIRITNGVVTGITNAAP